MQRQVSTLIGTLIIIAVAVVLFGGVFVYQYVEVAKLHKIQANLNVQNSNTKTADYFEIKEAGLKFKITDDIKDLTYSVKNETNNGETIFFSTKLLEQKGGVYCNSDNAPLGAISIFPKNSDEGGREITYLIKSDNLYVTYEGSQATCSDVKSVQEIQTKQVSILKNALKTIFKFRK